MSQINFFVLFRNAFLVFMATLGLMAIFNKESNLSSTSKNPQSKIQKSCSPIEKLKAISRTCES